MEDILETKTRVSKDYKRIIEKSKSSTTEILIKFVLLIILSGFVFLLAYKLSLGIIIYVLAPLTVALVYVIIWFSLELSKYSKNQNEILKQIDDLPIIKSVVESPHKTSTTIKNDVSPELRLIDSGNIQIYLSYKKLYPDTLINILEQFNKIYLTIYGLSIPELSNKSKEFQSYGQFIIEVEKFLKTQPEDKLRIYAIDTGNSIEIKFGPGWEFTIPVEKIPKSVIVLILSCYFIQEYAQFRNTHLSNQKINSEIEKIDLEKEKLRYEIKEHRRKNKDTFYFEDRLKSMETFGRTLIEVDNLRVEVYKDTNLQILDSLNEVGYKFADSIIGDENIKAMKISGHKID